MTGVYAVAGLTALCGLLVFIIFTLSKRVKRYKAGNRALREAVRDAAAQLERLKENTAKNRSIEEAANAKRRELGETADGGLAGRANRLF
jgi:predicted Holliday junction resolvase-like endonuclease